MKSLKGRQIFLSLFLILCVTSVQIHKEIAGVTMGGVWSKNTDMSILGMPSVFSQKNFPKGQIQSQSWEEYWKIQGIKQDSQGIIGFLVNSGSASFLIQQFSENRYKVNIQLRSSKYINERVVEIPFTLSKGYSKQNNEWKTPKILISAHLYENLQHLVTLDLSVNFQMKQTKKNQIQINLISDSANIKIDLKPQSYTYVFPVFVILINVVQFIILLFFTRTSSVTHQSQLSNTSQWFILHTLLFSIVTTFFLARIGFGLLEGPMGATLIALVTNLCVILMWLRAFESVLQKLKNKTKLFIAICFSFIYFYLVYKYYHVGMFWALESCFMLWQICYGILRGGEANISIMMLIVVFLGRLPLIMFFRKQNPFKLRPDLVVSWIILSSMIIHSIILIMQKQWGGRFFTPKSIMPDYFNYLRTTLYSAEIAQKQCAICTNLIKFPHNETPQQQKKRQQQEKKQEFKNKQIQYVETPCHHIFHTECLKEWMQAHLICPMDRNGLPPMNL